MINLETWVEELPKEKFFSRINMEDCLVTISMLISNRIDTVEKCFESFRPLLEQIPSEFIAVDTVGDKDSDGSIDVARRYADKIVHFEWCDDFAAARNAGLREARGKWLIYLDDDEWFDDIGPLIDFFSKPELYNNYDRVTVLEQSYTTATQTECTSNRFARICRISPDSIFTGAVHEMLTGVTVRNEYDLKDTFIHHVGYVGKLGVKKAERNRRIMDRELAENPGNLHTWLQQIGGCGDNKKKLLEVSERAVRTIRNLHLTDWTSFEWVEIFIYRMKAYARLRMWDELKSSTEEILANVSDSFYKGIVARINISRNLADFDQQDMYEWLKIYMDSVEYCENIDLLKDYITCFIGDVKKQSMYDFVLQYCKLCSEECDDSYESIRKVFFELPWECECRERRGVLAYSLMEAVNEGDSEAVEFMAEKFVSDNVLSEEFTTSLDRIRVGLETEVAVDSFKRIVSGIGIENDSLWIMSHTSECVSQKILDDELSSDVTASGANEGLLEICVNSGLSPERYVENISWEEFANAVSMVIEGESRHLDRIPEFAAKVEKCWKKCLKREYFLSSLRKRYIFQGSMLFSRVMEESDLYCDNVISCAESMYAPELCRTCSNVLPAEIRFAMILRKALDCRKDNDMKHCLRYLSEALDVFPSAETLIKRMVQSMEREQRRETAVSDELVKLGNQVKAQIAALISQGQLEVARSLLNELKQITPDDGDIVTLENLCK
ncbi:glycosyltransferase [Ligilactobacillus sp.]|uniref:glycosyltransferase n=1 Tax=Ligilactobacillus sp. TaxID=2767921 RepID=UPI002FE128B9